ncbi:4-hydroxy-tetrahydrodipicolinate synthase [Kitasatospora acidiphila]|uniref:4-hydroxy-tetrahydrodipicolinate synthase n=1 Tax=Kitasatospora acidiphila TaxID=2567942 RepID=A0A540W9Y0_9ACTN|nr:dihydrodipicolinate synthase family protein [Kitasatospora acidiphila]TQF05825.1 4-hydroxy-tetrahydrodipicolinate synthase [Kitasatospora acidiphila]
METTLRGIYVPLVTPFTADGRLDLAALEKLANGVLDDGAAGLVALGTTGEPGALDTAEQSAVVETCTRVCQDRGAALVVGVGGGATRQVAAALRELTPAATAALTLVPPFVRPGAAGVLAHFKELVAASPVPLVAYHIPYRTGQSLDAEALRELAALPGIAGVKLATGAVDPEVVALLGGELPPHFAVLGGDDVVLPPLLALGAAGGIMASAHIATARWAELVDAWQAGDVARARDLGHRLSRLAAALFTEPNPTVVKGVLHAQGRISSPAVRLPLLPASEASVSRALDLAVSTG